MMRTVRPAGGGPSNTSEFFSSRAAPSPIAGRAVGKVRGCVSAEASELIEHLHHGVQAADDVRLVAAEGRKPERGELRLELADVVAAKREIVNQIRGARAVLGVNPGGIDHARSFELQHLGAEKIELLD